MRKTPLNPERFGDIRLRPENFDIPPVGQIVFARIVQRRDADNKAIPDSIAKIQFEVVNYELVKVIAERGGKASDLNTIQLELVTDEATMKRYVLEDQIGKLIALKEVDVAPRWVSRANSGSWGGFKLIASTLNIVSPTTAKTTT